jgi:hypothetical protein
MQSNHSRRWIYLVAAMLLVPLSSSVATQYVLTEENIITALDLTGGGAPLVTELLPGGPDNVQWVTATEIGLRWYAGGPRYGEILLLLTNVRRINGVEVPEEGGSPVDQVHLALPRGETIEVEFGVTGGRVLAWFMDSATNNEDNHGQAYLDVGPPSAAVADAQPQHQLELTAGPSPAQSWPIDIMFAVQSPAGEGELSVHDVQGRMIRRVPVPALSQGIHSIAWDGRDEYGEQATAGVYFLNLVLDSRRAGRGRVIVAR